MADRYMLVQWHDPNDKVLNDVTKFDILNEDVTNPSLVGLAPDLEYFAERIPFVNPNPDYRLAYVQEAKTMTEDKEVSTGVRYYDLTYTVIDRTISEKKKSIDNEKNMANFGVFPNAKHLEYIVMYAAMAHRRINNQNITPRMQTLIDKVEAKVTKMWQNHITALSKKDAADNSQPINIDDDWQKKDPEDEV